MLYLSMIREEMMNYYKFSKAEQIEIARRSNVTRKDDYIWCYIRDAKCYAQITVAGRRYINDLMKNGYEYEPFEMSVDHFYGNDLVDFNRDAHFWHIIFSPIAENEDKPKVWIKFPNTDTLVWFFIEDYNEKDGFILSPNPRMKYTAKWFNEYEGEFEAIVQENPKSIAYALEMCTEYFTRNNVVRPSDSRMHYHSAFLIHPIPVRKSGDGTKQKLKVFSQDIVS